MAKITLQQLKNKNACNKQVELFEKLFGESVEVTTELAIEMASEFDWNWAAQNLLSNEGRKIYNEANVLAVKTHKEATVLAWKTYQEVGQEVGQEVYAAVLKNYLGATAPARKICDEALDAAYKILYRSLRGILCRNLY